jgi:NAD(P)-dependent dehydrogenase (short-subunit alcohol dehydrogenase family)
MAKWTAADIPSQKGRVAVVTGANTGLGFETASVLAQHGAHIVMSVRNLEKGKDAATRIRQRHPGVSVAPQELDLSSLDSIHAAAEQLRSDHDHIDLLINNAGVQFTPKSATENGFESHFGTNHLGHFALTGLLLDRMLGVADSRVVTVSSSAHRTAHITWDDLQWERRYSRASAYGTSKLANLLFTYELQRRLTGTTTISVASHPGAAKNDLIRSTSGLLKLALLPGVLIQQEPAMGVLPTLRAATDPGVLGGQYFGPSGLGQMRGYPKIVASSKRSHNTELQRRLWGVSEELTGVFYPV